MKTNAFPLLAALLIAFPAFAQDAGEAVGQWMGRVLAVVVLVLAGWRLYSRHRDEIAERKRKEWRRRMLEQDTSGGEAPATDVQREETDA